MDENSIRETVQEIAEKTQQKLQIKRIVTYASNEKRHINIECIFSGNLSLEDAHALASQTEEQVQERFAETIVTVHMEPSLKPATNTKS